MGFSKTIYLFTIKNKNEYNKVLIIIKIYVSLICIILAVGDFGKILLNWSNLPILPQSPNPPTC